MLHGTDQRTALSQEKLSSHLLPAPKATVCQGIIRRCKLLYRIHSFPFISGDQIHQSLTIREARGSIVG
jgi:hypothetical protein